MNAVKKLSDELNRWGWLKVHLQSENFDAVSLMSALASETEIPECLLKLAEEALESKALAAAAKARAKEITERAGRLEEKAEKLRRVITATFRNAGITEPIRGATITLSLRPTGRTVIITDVGKIPKEYFDDADPKLNKLRLHNAMSDGTKIEGAELSNGGEAIAILTK